MTMGDAEDLGEDLPPQEFWDRRLAVHFTLRGAGCRMLGWQYNAWLYRLRRRVFMRHVRRLDVAWPAARVADIGSGTGFYIELWRRLGVRSVVGVDFAPTAVERLRARYPQVQVVLADISRPLAEDLGGPFDAISAMDVLFHIMDDAGYVQALQTLSRLLVPGGYLLFTDCFVRGTVPRAPHCVWRPLDTIVSWLEAASLRPVLRAPVFVVMNAPVASRRPWAHRLWESLCGLVRAGEPLGFLAGAVLYPLELVLTSLLRESPSTELMICRKQAGP